MACEAIVIYQKEDEDGLRGHRNTSKRRMRVAEGQVGHRPSGQRPIGQKAKWAGGQVGRRQVGHRPSGPEAKWARGQVGRRLEVERS
jgi:hypothetical protein